MAGLIRSPRAARPPAVQRCVYCEGKGYLACASCGATGKADDETACDPASPAGQCSCPYCSGAGKVMCPSCLCTGMTVSTEHDPRIDPFV